MSQLDRFIPSPVSRRRYPGVVLALAMILGGCVPTPPEVFVFGTLPRGVDPTISVTAAREKEAITRALRQAGFRVTERLEESAYLVRVTIGVAQKSQACGTLNNVSYELRSQGQTVIEVVAKGWTGSCEPNVFDAVSRELRSRVVAMTTQEESK